MGSLALEEYELMKDSKYRVYVSAVDKALKSFEYTSEWADLISALGKLNKVLLTYMKFPVIPRRIKISKRLAQCMHPALPSGVHLKALETYDIIFKCMGTNRLSQELFIYSSGLFPLLGHAAMNVRPLLLTVYETHFVPLGERLRPGLSGFLSGVLPGLEEGSDHFDRTNSLLEKVCAEVGPSHFYGCLWDCLASNCSIRLPAISYVLSHFNKKLTMEDQLYIMGTNIDVMVNALCACVQDSSVLVQRSALDLLLIGFPMHNSQLVRADMARLVTASLVTILRRDMSLNRRLFAWLSGSEVNLSLLNPEHPLVKRASQSPEHNLYFHMYSKDMLVQAIKVTLNQNDIQTPYDLRSYRLLVSLLDKPDIGPVILDDILFEVFRSLYLACNEESATKGNGLPKGSQELLKSANLLFSTLEPFYIWVYIGTLFSSACSRHTAPSANGRPVKPVGSGQPSLLEVCVLAEFLLDTVSLETYMDTTSEHLPSLFLHIVDQLVNHCHSLSPRELSASLQLCTKILSRVRPSPLASPPDCSARKTSESTESRSPSEGNQAGDDAAGEVFDRSRAYSDSFSEKKSPKSNKAAAKTKKSASSKFRIKGLGKNYKAHSISTPVLLSVVSNDPERVPSQEKQDEDVDSGLGTSLGSGISFTSQARSSFDLTSYHAEESKVTVEETESLQVQPLEKVPVCASPVPTKQQCILEQCRREYEKFYVTFIQKGPILGEHDMASLYQKLLITKSVDSIEEHAGRLKELLEACLNSRKNSSTVGSRELELVRKEEQGDLKHCQVIPVGDISIWEDSMKGASDLLVELSTFPSYCLPEPILDDSDSSVAVLPEWLRVLVVCSCWLAASPSLQLVAISTLLDLVSLLRSQSLPEGAAGAGEAQGSVVPVVLVPLLRPAHVAFIEHSTNVEQVLAHSLWSHLGQLPSRYHTTCVELLHQLHGVLPCNDAVESVIGEALASGCPQRQLEAFQRFSVLWHVGRHVDAHSARTFDKCLLKMLDTLQTMECCPLKLQAQSWLLHSLLRGDVSRLLDALLLMLLDPATARMSVLHVSIAHSEPVPAPEDDDAARIYAIGSVDGNVIYHVSDRPSRRADPVKAKRIFAVTTLMAGGKGRCVTEKNLSLGEAELLSSSATGRKRNISLFVNPFAASGSSNNNSVDSTTEDDSTSNSIKDDALKSSEYPTKAKRLVPGKKNGVAEISGTEDKLSADEDSSDFLKCASRKSVQENEYSSSSDEGSAVVSRAADDTIPSDGDLEVSTTAEDYFGASGESSVSIVEDILHDVLDDVVNQCDKSEAARPAPPVVTFSFTRPAPLPRAAPGVHPLHSHLLLYCGVYDSGRALYALDALRALLATNPRVCLCAAATAGPAASSPRAPALLGLLARHRKSVFGLAGPASEFASAYRSSMYLEVLILVCLYFARSFYPNLGQMRLTQDELSGNRQVQLASTELLMLICSELILIVRDSGKGFACYIADVLSRCKVQKVVLHCVLSSVHSMKTVAEKVNGDKSSLTFTEEIVQFNNPPVDRSGGCKFRSSDYAEGFQIQLLRLLLSLLMLEHQVNAQKGDADAVPTGAGKETQAAAGAKSPSSSFQLKYVAGLPIPQQPMFLAAILSALRQEHMRHMHQHWTTLVASALPFMGQSLMHVVMSVINQLCSNLEKLASFYSKSCDTASTMQMCCLPPDYSVTQLEALTLLCHYCLLDSTQQVSHAFSQQLLAGAASIQFGVPGANPGQIFNNLIHVFMPSPQQDAGSVKDKASQAEAHLAARRLVLSNLPRIIASVAALWQAVTASCEWEKQSCVLGSPRVVKHQLLEFLSPISLHHGTNFVAAIAVAWQERKSTISSSKVIPVANTDQQVLVYLVGAIRAMPMDTLVQTVHQVVKQPPPIQGAGEDLSLEVSMLELFYCYMQTSSGPQLAESWGSLLGLLRDGLALSPPALFLMLAVLNEFVQKIPPLAEKKDQRDLQDITAKLIESCAQIAGTSLEQTTWLRRNLAVKEEEPSQAASRDKDGSVLGSSPAQYSVQAQMVLAELLSPLLDVSYGSQEKERVVALLTTVMYNITPYLRNHTRRNVPCFRACSQLLANLSSYQYTRKAWRRDVFDLLLDSTFFQMEGDCLICWRTVVDNLMTHDTTTFRDLMSRVSLAQSGSLSIFSSREQEYELRAQLLKRLAFVILCSETDQYHKYMPEIQERLADSLRLPQVVPSVQAQVFLCFRVLLLRMSPQHVTSLWPIIISEMVQVFLHIEQELSTDTEEFSSHIRVLSALDASWVVNSSNGLHAHGHPHWLQLQLASAKLLDLACLLPAHRLPQFQMYRWAFVGVAKPSNVNNNIPDEGVTHTGAPDFVPHVVRIKRLMDNKFGGAVEASRAQGQLLLASPTIRTLQELHAFFTAMSAHCSSTALRDSQLGVLEAVVERDFLERLPAR
ncbi:protein dopey-1 homolog isoform X2 [Bacillus rossius redtenbacheri]|uniref:protein dopey-1 homolog isoform X2 n=1 Tax=Bacillus rossius redtenbacheri TaxID=93214 RepID=UPI002FDD4AB2